MTRDILGMTLQINLTNVRDPEYKATRRFAAIDPFAQNAELFEFADAISSFHAGDRVALKVAQTFEVNRGSMMVPDN
ncbi:hypothetical protein [Lacticaseibacillus mingshuiensis]|uniref:Uncharacterized protein n=1 Tax=Lacticaseibacillus mingshuiensis TaxID=2799574 RepID=A0ABW4CIR0_9LACO|nr:hypothetical protein [Lacticaseibacillus mingshuiensis]